MSSDKRLSHPWPHWGNGRLDINPQKYKCFARPEFEAKFQKCSHYNWRGSFFFFWLFVILWFSFYVSYYVFILNVLFYVCCIAVYNGFRLLYSIGTFTVLSLVLLWSLSVL